MVSKGRLRSVLRELDGCFNAVSRKFQESFKLSILLSGNFKGVSSACSRIVEEYLTSVSKIS